MLSEKSSTHVAGLTAEDVRALIVEEAHRFGPSVEKEQKSDTFIKNLGSGKIHITRHGDTPVPPSDWKTLCGWFFWVGPFEYG